MITDLERYFAGRAGWLDLGIVRRNAVQYSTPTVGNGHDVVLRLDGAYMRGREAELAARDFWQELADLGLFRRTPVWVEDLT